MKLAGFPAEDPGLSCRGFFSAFVGIWFWLSWGFRCSWGGLWAFVGRVSGFAWEDFCFRGGGGFRAFVGRIWVS